MSVEVDFAQSGQVFQAAGTQNPWIVTWEMDSNHYYGVSFVPDSNRSNLQVISIAYDNDPAGNVSIHVVLQNNGLDAVFRAAAIQVPNKW